VKIASALEYAHQQGPWHRDIKPSNLLLDAHGTVWITDFGLAKATDDEDLTHTGDIVGTVRYMAPERFRGRCDASADVYALGLTLYELLAFRPAFPAGDRHDLIRQITQEEPPRLRRHRPSPPLDPARPGADRAQGDRQGPGPSVRLGPGPGRGLAAVPRRSADPGPSIVGHRAAGPLGAAQQGAGGVAGCHRPVAGHARLRIDD